jgi:DNA-binding response OmpR family regulator
VTVISSLQLSTIKQISTALALVTKLKNLLTKKTMTLAILFTNSQSRAELISEQLTQQGISLEIVKLDRGLQAGLAKLGKPLGSAVALVDSTKLSQHIAEIVELNTAPAVMAIVDRPSVDAAEAALNAGAKDFVVCPIQPVDLVVRVKRMIERVQNSRRNPKSFQSGPYFFDVEGRQLTVDKDVVSLTDKEFELALALFRDAGEVLPRDELASKIWGHPSLSHSRTIDTHMSRLRRKLDLQPNRGFRLVSVYDVGYRLDILDRDARE